MTRETRHPRVMVVDDQRAMAEMVAEGLHDRGFDAVAVSSGTEALAMLESMAVDALVTDLRMAPVDGLALLAASRTQDPDRPVIVMTAFGAIDSAVEAVRQGAYHYLAKPFKQEELAIFLRRAMDAVALRREAAALRRTVGALPATTGMLGGSKAMRAVREVIARVADTAATVILGGETGTGKGLAALALHAGGRRARGPFVSVNCAALPDALLESELFGAVKGAFTGATHNRDGLFTQASGGTLFLDEIAELPLSLQAKLLHVLERGMVRPVGGAREHAVDVRIIAATHWDLRDRVHQGRFREDLLYRLDLVSIELPPLRARPEDIPELVDHFMAVARGRYPSSGVEGVSRATMTRLMDYPWPGNVRELAHVIERSVLLGSGRAVEPDALPKTVREGVPQAGVPFVGEVIPMREMQKRYARWALEQLGGHRMRTADQLDVDIKTLGKLLVTDNPEVEKDPR